MPCIPDEKLFPPYFIFGRGWVFRSWGSEALARSMDPKPVKKRPGYEPAWAVFCPKARWRHKSR